MIVTGENVAAGAAPFHEDRLAGIPDVRGHAARGVIVNGVYQVMLVAVSGAAAVVFERPLLRETVGYLRPNAILA